MPCNALYVQWEVLPTPQSSQSLGTHEGMAGLANQTGTFPACEDKPVHRMELIRDGSTVSKRQGIPFYL